MNVLSDVAGRRWDAVVIGAGPAGTIAARQLARGGAKVLLIERAALPRSKVCGCCLSAAALGAIGRAGLGNLPDRLGARPLGTFHFHTPWAHPRLSIPPGAAVSRERLDAALAAEAVAAGARLLDATTASVRASPPDSQVLLARKGAQAAVTPGVILVADGLSGRALGALPEFAPQVGPGRRIGVATTLPGGPGLYADGTIWMAYDRAAYVGLVRLENGRLEVAAALPPARLRQEGGPRPVLESILRRNGLPIPRSFQRAAWRGTPTLMRRRPRLAGPRLLVLGDAAGYAEPITGEGMAWAMISAMLAAPLALQGASGWNAELEDRWERMRHRAIGPRERFCRRLARVLNHPSLVASAALALRTAPVLAIPFLKAMNTLP